MIRFEEADEGLGWRWPIAVSVEMEDVGGLGFDKYLLAKPCPMFVGRPHGFGTVWRQMYCELSEFSRELSSIRRLVHALGGIECQGFRRRATAYYPKQASRRCPVISGRTT